LRFGLVDVSDAGSWINDTCWIVMSYDGGFAQYLEQYYFAPGTPKNAEFEVLVSRIEVDGVLGYAILYRIKDTVENRESLRAAISEFYEKSPLSLAQLDHVIEDLRQDFRTKVIPKLR
jgi:hypothetical protein